MTTTSVKEMIRVIREECRRERLTDVVISNFRAELGPEYPNVFSGSNPPAETVEVSVPYYGRREGENQGDVFDEYVVPAVRKRTSGWTMRYAGGGGGTTEFSFRTRKHLKDVRRKERE